MLLQFSSLAFPENAKHPIDFHIWFHNLATSMEPWRLHFATPSSKTQLSQLYGPSLRSFWQDPSLVVHISTYIITHLMLITDWLFDQAPELPAHGWQFWSSSKTNTEPSLNGLRIQNPLSNFVVMYLHIIPKGPVTNNFQLLSSSCPELLGERKWIVVVVETQSKYSDKQT